MAMEKGAAECLLANMLPEEIVERLKDRRPTAGGSTNTLSHIADHHDKVTILFADIAGFTRLANSLPPAQVVAFLNDIFSRFDACLEKYDGLNKIKTIGDCYMVASVPMIVGEENHHNHQTTFQVGT